MMTDKNISFMPNKERVQAFFEKIPRALLTDANDDEIYFVRNYFRYDKIDLSSDTFIFSSVFKKIENIREFILNAENFLEDHLDEDDLERKVFWSIEKFRMVNGEFERVLGVNQIGAHRVFLISFDSDEIEYYSDLELALLKELRQIKNSRFSCYLQNPAYFEEIEKSAESE